MFLQKLIVEWEAEVLLVADEVELVRIEVGVQAAVRDVGDALPFIELAVCRTGLRVDLSLVFEYPAALLG